jgi:site-specific recombinase XerD
MGTIRYVLRTDKIDMKETNPVQLVYQISGQRKYFTTSIKLRTENWNSEKQIGVYLDKKNAKKLLPAVGYNDLPNSGEIDSINSDLANLKREISEIETKFKLNRIPYSATMVIEALKEAKTPTTKKSHSSNEVYEFIDRYVTDNKATRKAASLGIHKALKQHLQDFQKDKKKRITFEGLDYSFFMEFQNYLIEKKGLNNTTVAKHLSTVKTFINYAKMHGVAVSDKYRDFKIRKESLEVIALTGEEFETLFNMDLSGNRKLDQVRDIFCFACTTGLRYSDMAQLEWIHIKNDEIRLTVQKTSEEITIPLNPYSSSIVEKYKGSPRPLPCKIVNGKFSLISNQKMNQYLNGKDDLDEEGEIVKHQPGLCEIAGIDEKIEIVRFRGAKRETKTYSKYELISVHTGRKTFATLSLEKGMSAEEVMACTGHRDYKSFKRYVKVTEKRKKIVMKKAWGELPLLKVV